MEEDSWEIGIEHGAWGMESDDRGQMTEDRRQKAAGRRQFAARGWRSEVRGQKTDDPSEIVAAGEFHGASRGQMAAFQF